MTMLRRIIVAAIVAGAFVIAALLAHAHDGVFDEWMGTLKSPVTGMSCCSRKDCFTTKSRVGADGWEAQTLTGEWVKIPNEIIIRGQGNPTGEPVLCYDVGRVLCFVEGITA